MIQIWIQQSNCIHDSLLSVFRLPFVISDNFSTDYRFSFIVISFTLNLFLSFSFVFFFILGFRRDWILCSLPRCHGYPMLIFLQYALSWPDLLVSDICFVCLFLENIPHVCEPYRDTTLSLLFML
jgi:hypothetical protein